MSTNVHRLLAAILLLWPGASPTWPHAGTRRSPHMSVENAIRIGPLAVQVVQVHRCRQEVARDVWTSADLDGDGRLTDDEWARAADDARMVYLRWCRLDVNFAPRPPRRITVDLTGCPRSRPTTFAPPLELSIRHVADYDLPPTATAGLWTLGFHASALNADRIETSVSTASPVRIERASPGTLDGTHRHLGAAVQSDGTPEEVHLLLSSWTVAQAAPPGGSGSAGPSPEEAGLSRAGVIAALAGVLALGLSVGYTLGRRAPGA